MSSTTIIASQTLMHPTLYLNLSGSPTVHDIFEKFIGILEKYKEEQDNISNAIFNLGTQISDVLIEQNDESFIDHLAEKIHELEQLLVGYLDQAPLKDPVIANGRLWERRMLTHIHHVGVQISFDGQELEIGKPYLLGSEIIILLNSLFESSDEEMMQLAKKLTEKRARTRELNSRGWLDLDVLESITSAEACQGYETLVQERKKFEVACRRLSCIQQITHRFAVVSQTAQERCRSLSANIKEAIATQEELHARDIQQIIAEKDAIICKLRKLLDKATKENTALTNRVESAEEQITTLRAEVQQLSVQNEENRRQNEENRRAGKKNRCIVM